MCCRILIVEDDSLLSMMLEEYLEKLGHQPVPCSGHLETALNEIAARNVDAAIMDVYIGNDQTSGVIAEALSAQKIPFIVSTGGFIADPAPVFEGRPLLMKPFSTDKLRQAVMGLVRSAECYSPNNFADLD